MFIDEKLQSFYVVRKVPKQLISFFVCGRCDETSAIIKIQLISQFFQLLRKKKKKQDQI